MFIELVNRRKNASSTGIHEYEDDQIDVVFGQSKYKNEKEERYISVLIKEYDLLVTGGEHHVTEARRMLKQYIKGYTEINWVALAQKWLATWVKDDPSRFGIIMKAAMVHGFGQGVEHKRQEWNAWYWDGLAKAGVKT